MSPTAALVKAALNSNFGWSVLRHRFFVQRRDRWLIPLILLGVAGFVPVLVLYVRLIGEVFDLLKSLGQEKALLTLAILTGQFLILVFGLFYLIATFYFSRDLEYLVSLPLKPFQVMLSKFTVVLVNEYLTVSLIILPALIVFGFKGKGGLEYWISLLLAYVLLPVIPLAASGLVVVGMMRLVNIGRKKDLLIVLGSLLLISAVMFLQFGLSRATRGQDVDTEKIIALIASPDGLVQTIGRRFPPSIWATRFLHDGLSTGSGLSGLALFGGLSVLLFGGLMAGAQRFFYRGLVGLSERSGGSARKSRVAKSLKIASGRHPIRAIFLREFRLMNRTPIFLLNGVLGVLMIPIVFALTLSSSKSTDDAAAILRLMTAARPLIIVLVTTMFIIICATVSGVASSSFSREGRNFWVSKVIPVDYRQQVMAKFVHSWSVALLGIASATAVLVFRFHLPVGRWLPSLALALPVTAFLTVLNLAIDLARPLLDWISPQKAMKQNLNVLIAMLLDVGFLFLFGLLFLALDKAGLGLAGVLIILFGLILGLVWLAMALIKRFALRRYPAIEA
jgi:ABC-2 type transport system permease protein